MKLLDLSQEELAQEIAKFNLPSYRTKQLFSELYRYIEFENMTVLPKQIRALLCENYRNLPLQVVDILHSPSAKKYLFKLKDDELIETVFLKQNYGSTICLSTQVGCKMNCSFCASGKNGFTRNLSSGEILAQVLKINSDLMCENEKQSSELDKGDLDSTAGKMAGDKSDCYGQSSEHNNSETKIAYASKGENYASIDVNADFRNAKRANAELSKGKTRAIDNIVLMGIGEPFDNYENVIKFLRLITAKEGINFSARNISLSTSGLAPKIRQFASENIPLNLCFSMHSAFDEKRQEIMPIAKKYSLDECLSALEHYYQKTHRRYIIEYAVMHGFNDREVDALKLKKLLAGKVCHINLIPLNKIDEFEVQTTPQHAKQFEKRLLSLGLSATIRKSSGSEIAAACGQLRRKFVGCSGTSYSGQND